MLPSTLRTHLKLSRSCRLRTRLSALRYTLFWDCATCRWVKHTHNTQVRKQSIKSHDLSELLSLHKVNRKTASNQHVSGRRGGGTGFLSHCVLAPSGGLHGQLHCEVPCKDQTGALGAGGVLSKKKAGWQGIILPSWRCSGLHGSFGASGSRGSWSQPPPTEHTHTHVRARLLVLS